MAKQSEATLIAGGCGHEWTIQLHGSYKDRDQKIEWFEREGLCGDCYKAQAAAEKREDREREERADKREQARKLLVAAGIDGPGALELVGMTQAEAQARPEQFLDAVIARLSERR